MPTLRERTEQMLRRRERALRPSPLYERLDLLLRKGPFSLADWEEHHAQAMKMRNPVQTVLLPVQRPL